MGVLKTKNKKAATIGIVDVRRFFIICTIFIISGCNTSDPVPLIPSDAGATYSSSTLEMSFHDITEAIAEYTETTTSAANNKPPVTRKSNNENKIPEDTILFNGLIDLHEAEYYSGGYADFNNLTLAGVSTGEFFTAENLTSFNEHFQAVKNNYIQREIKAVRSNTELMLDTLTVTAAGCELSENYNYINNQYLYCTGEITLSGVLRYRKQNDLLGTEVGRKGDVFFYPYPSDISDLPLILSCGYFSPAMILDEDNGFYMLSDTIELLLGNTETKMIHTRINEIRDTDIPVTDPCYNEKIENYLSDSEYYLATLSFTDLFLLSYQDKMTGQPHSCGNVSEIKFIEAMQLQSG